MTDHDILIARHHIGCFANGQPDTDFAEWARDALPAILEELLALRGADEENDKLRCWLEDHKEEVQGLKDELRECREELRDARKDEEEARHRAGVLADELEYEKHRREKAAPLVPRKIAQDFRDDLEDAIPPIVPPSPQPRRANEIESKLRAALKSDGGAVVKISGDSVEIQAQDVPEPEQPREVVDKVFSTGDVAKFCKVTPRTVSLWFDRGKLGGYRVPGSHDRRIPARCLVKFLRDNGMPVPEELYEKGQ